MRSFNENIRNFEIFTVKKVRQIKVRFALLSQNVNKLSRIFRLLILNHYPKLCILIFPPKINIKLSMTVILSVFGV